MLAWALAAYQEDYGQSSGGGFLGALFGGVFFLIWLAVLVLVIASLWKIFEKAGKPGWAAIVPIYNIIVLLEIVRKPLWWIVLFLIPCVNFIAAVLIALELAKVFGKSAGFAVGLIFLPFIFYPMLAFGDARYQAV
jgi:uncharacterized membrane protein YhaH (DUF805 family)